MFDAQATLDSRLACNPDGVVSDERLHQLTKTAWNSWQHNAESVLEEPIPHGLDELAPGPFLAAVLSCVDATRLSGHDRVIVLRARQRLLSHVNAGLYADMASISDHIDLIEPDAELASDSTAAEVRAALGLTRRYADSELGFALDLIRRIPRVFSALSSGVIDVRQAKTIVHGTAHLPDETAREVADEITPDAPRMTTTQLAARIRRICIAADPEEAEARYRHTVADRRTFAEMTAEGTANMMGLNLPPDRVAQASRRINEIAKTLRREGEKRTIDQLRADVYLDLLTGVGTKPGSSSGAVEIRVDLQTLAELDETPGDLAGFGPVIADIARQVARDQTRAKWRFVVTQPETGVPLHTGVTRRRPTSGQQHLIQARDQFCIFPGCRMPAAECDLDHRIQYSRGGPTETGNLHPLCRHDHRIKDNLGWIYETQPDGTFKWTSRLQHTYITTGQPP